MSGRGEVGSGLPIDRRRERRSASEDSDGWLEEQQGSGVANPHSWHSSGFENGLLHYHAVVGDHFVLLLQMADQADTLLSCIRARISNIPGLECVLQ